MACQLSGGIGDDGDGRGSAKLVGDEVEACGALWRFHWRSVVPAAWTSMRTCAENAASPAAMASLSTSISGATRSYASACASGLAIAA
jgi:hypothetical protein